jgi:hypothetical protein
MLTLAQENSDSKRGRTAELEGLSLTESTQITDAGLEQLKGLSRLQLLDLEGTQITDEAVGDFKQAVPNCVIMK